MTIATARALTLTLCVLSLVATTVAEPAAWPLTSVAGLVALVLTWTAFGDGSVAAPVVVLIGVATPFMFGDGGVAVGPLAACVLALAAGELLWGLRATADQGTAVVRRVGRTQAAVSSVGVASVAVVVIMLASLLPNHRLWSLAAVVAIVGLAA